MPYKDVDIARAYQREYQREWIKRRRGNYIEGKACQKCGAVSDLEIHHRNPSEKTEHRIWSWTCERLEAELEKCDILCRGCHNEAHMASIQHGTLTTYKTHGCRCSECRAANAMYEANRRRSTGPK